MHTCNLYNYDIIAITIIYIFVYCVTNIIFFLLYDMLLQVKISIAHHLLQLITQYYINIHLVVLFVDTLWRSYRPLILKLFCLYYNVA